MQLVKTANGNQILRMTKSDWLDIGRKKNWLRSIAYAHNLVIDEYKGLKLLVDDDVERGEGGGIENVKRFHYVVGADGKQIPLALSPYTEGIAEFRLWVDLKLPPNNNGSNWHLNELQALAKQRPA